MKLILTFALITFIKFTSSELTLIKTNKQIFRDKRQNDVQLLRLDTSNLNNFRSFRYELSDETSRREAIQQFIDSMKDNQVSGAYKYISKEGYVVKTSFTSDDKGYVPKVLFGKNVKYVPMIVYVGDLQFSLIGDGVIEGGSQGATTVSVGNNDLLCSLVGGNYVCI